MKLCKQLVTVQQAQEIFSLYPIITRKKSTPLILEPKMNKTTKTKIDVSSDYNVHTPH